MAKHRTAQSYRRSAPKRVSSDVFLIVTEGKVTEPEYFKALCAALNMSKVDVEVCQSEFGTDPLNIVAYADKLKKDRFRQAKKSGMVVAYDQVWVVFDQEGPENGRNWQGGLDSARDRGFRVVFSNPSFEFWLLLHHEYTTALFANSGAVETRLKSKDSGYGKHAGQTDFAKTYLPETAKAITNARRVRADHAQTETRNPYTDADELVIHLSLAVREHNRICPIKVEWIQKAKVAPQSVWKQQVKEFPW